MHALVTGCAGFIGSHVTDTLLADGHTVRGIDAFTDYYDTSIKRQNLVGAQRNPRFELIDADLLRTETSELLDGIDVVIHEAGQPGVRASWDAGFNTYVDRNVRVTQVLLEAVRSHPVDRFVDASSSSIYGNAPQYPTTEEMLPRPHSPYGVTKLAGEHLCSLYAANWGIPAMSLRYFTVYGPRQRPDMGIARFIHAAARNERIRVFGDGSHVRDFTFVADVVRATLAAATQEIPPGEVCNIAGGSATTVTGLLGVIARAMNVELLLDHDAEQPGDVRETGGAIDRAHSLLGWAPSTDRETGVKAQIAWAREGQDPRSGEQRV